MKKFNTRERVTIGMDISDRSCHVVALYEEDGEIAWEGKLTTRGAALQKFFSQVAASRIALEAGPHSGWIWRLLSSLGQEVWVANARKLRLIYENQRKSDRVDAMDLARIARMDPLLLSPIEHRSEEAQADLGVLQARESLVRCRSRLISFCRSQVKTFGFRLPACSTASFHHKVQGELPWQCQSALDPIIDELGNLTEKIRVYDRQVDRLCNEKYPQTARLREIRGVGSITALAYVLVIDDPLRFARSRDVGADLGMCPGQRQSGNRDQQLRITKEGNRYVRSLLVQCAHYILGHFGEDCDLRRKGEALISRGGSGARKKAAVAIARKLAVLMHRLWVADTLYDPFYQSHRQAA